jgi:hypothetical protein
MNHVAYAPHILFDSLFTTLMFKTFTLAAMLAVLMAHLPLEAATPFFKCTNNGKVTYQSVPCPSGERRDIPTVDKLNAERQKRLLESGITPSTSSAAAVAPIEWPVNSFKCDGRTHCSQMTSCSEAKYFLKHCPGVKMDGDRDGIPCEEQWCSK